MNPDVVPKLLRLALCPSAPDGEVAAAMRRLAAVLRGQRDPVAALGQLLAQPQPMPAPRRMPAADAEIGFGKYSGCFVSEIARRDPDYVLWAAENMNRCRPGLRAAFRAWAEHLEAA